MASEDPLEPEEGGRSRDSKDRLRDFLSDIYDSTVESKPSPPQKGPEPVSDDRETGEGRSTLADEGLFDEPEGREGEPIQGPPSTPEREEIPVDEPERKDIVPPPPERSDVASSPEPEDRGIDPFAEDTTDEEEMSTSEGTDTGLGDLFEEEPEPGEGIIDEPPPSDDLDLFGEETESPGPVPPSPSEKPVEERPAPEPVEGPDVGPGAGDTDRPDSGPDAVGGDDADGGPATDVTSDPFGEDDGVTEQEIVKTSGPDVQEDERVDSSKGMPPREARDDLFDSEADGKDKEADGDISQNEDDEFFEPSPPEKDVGTEGTGDVPAADKGEEAGTDEEGLFDEFLSTEGTEDDKGIKEKKPLPEEEEEPIVDKASPEESGTPSAIDTQLESPETRKVDERFTKARGPYEKLLQNARAVRDEMSSQIKEYYRELSGKKTEKKVHKEREIFNPIMITVQEFIMLSSGLLLASIFMIFALYKDFWYEYFDYFNTALFLVFGLNVLIGILILFFGDADTPRLRGSLKKKVYFSFIGILIVTLGSILFFMRVDESGSMPFALSIFITVGIFFMVICSRSMSTYETLRFIPFYIGTVLLLSVPIHETMDVAATDFQELPLAPMNLALIVLGSSLIMMGIYLLRERSGYFGVWLFGILILFLIPLHEFIDYKKSGTYESFDQTVAIIGSFLVLTGYMMFFYRYRQFMSMTRSIFDGNRYYEKGIIDRAEVNYRRAFWILEKMGNLLDYEVIWGNIGNIYTQKRDFDSAVAYFEMGITINPENDVLWNDKGNLNYLRGEYRKAIEAYEKGISLNKRNATLYQNLAVAQSAIGHHEEAIVNYDSALKLQPEYDKAWHNKGKSYHDLGNFEESLKCYDIALRFNPESYAWLDRGDVLYILKRYREALKSYDRSVKAHSQDPESWIRRGVCRYALKIYDQAVEDFAKAIELDTSLTLPHNLLGNTYAQLGDLDKAKEHYQIAIDMDPDYSRARFNLARTQAQMGEDAIETYEMAVRVTTSKRSNELLFDEAIQYYNRILDEHSNNVEAWKARGNLLFKIGKMNSAISSYVRAVELDPDNPKLHNLLGIALRKTQQLEAALESLNNATKLDPNFIEAWNNMGNVLYHMGRLHDAVKAYNRAIEINPDYRSALVNRRQCIRQLKSDAQIESVPLKSEVEDYMMVIDEYRNQGYKVDILENLLQEGKPNVILRGFEDYKKRVARLKEAENALDDLDLDPGIKDQLMGMMKDPSSLNLVLKAIGQSGGEVRSPGKEKKTPIEDEAPTGGNEDTMKGAGEDSSRDSDDDLLGEDMAPVSTDDAGKGEQLEPDGTDELDDLLGSEDQGPQDDHKPPEDQNSYDDQEPLENLLRDDDREPHEDLHSSDKQEPHEDLLSGDDQKPHGDMNSLNVSDEPDRSRREETVPRRSGNEMLRELMGEGDIREEKSGMRGQDTGPGTRSIEAGRTENKGEMNEGEGDKRGEGSRAEKDDDDIEDFFK